jgi:rare lipoprotein A
MSLRSRRCTSALSGVLAAISVTAPAALADGGNGGATAPTAGDNAGTSLALSSRRSVYVGRTLSLKGTDARAAGHQVLVQSRGSDGLWTTVATAAGDSGGAFRASWKPARPGRYLVRAVLADGQAAGQAGSADAGQPPRAVTVYRVASASWYGPGFYGKRTACGVRLTRATVGVAHRSLPCGTIVSISFKGHTVTAPVIDRGPFARGVAWDLTSATAEQLGITVTSRIGVAPIQADTVAPHSG